MAMSAIDRERAGPGPDDDDLIVELEQDTRDFVPPEEDEEVAEAQGERVLASTVPEDEEGELGEEDDQGEETSPRKRDKDAGEEVNEYESYERTTQAEDALRQERAARIWDNAQAQAAHVEQQRNNLQVGKDALKLRLEVAYSYLAAAKANDDNQGVIEHERNIRQMEQLAGELDDAGRRLPDANAILNDGRGRVQQALASAPSGKRVGNGIQARHPLAERWANQNGWMKTNAPANRFIIAQSQKMTDEGFDPNSPGFYAELGRRVKNAYPQLRVANLQASRRAPGRGQVRSPVAAPSRADTGSGVTSSNGKRRYKLTLAEQSKMKRFNLDPSNPKHAKAWAETRLESAARERNMG